MHIRKKIALFLLFCTTASAQVMGMRQKLDGTKPIGYVALSRYPDKESSIGKYVHDLLNGVNFYTKLFYDLKIIKRNNLYVLPIPNENDNIQNISTENLSKIINTTLQKNNQWFFGIKKYEFDDFKFSYYKYTSNDRKKYTEKQIINHYVLENKAKQNISYFKIEGSSNQKLEKTKTYKIITYGGNITALCIIGYGIYYKLY